MTRNLTKTLGAFGVVGAIALGSLGAATPSAAQGVYFGAGPAWGPGWGWRHRVYHRPLWRGPYAYHVYHRPFWRGAYAYRVHHRPFWRGSYAWAGPYHRWGWRHRYWRHF